MIPAVPQLARRLRSFHSRRIAIPVDADALVLDVGSGDKPHWRADVLLDRCPDEEDPPSDQAAGRVSKPLFIADAADMPFADGVFDYVVCSHVLEHVPDPAAVIAEITRVGHAGYIEVPQAASAKILDFPSHLWWCRLDGPMLVFTAKHGRAFDPEIAGYIERSGVERELERLLDRAFEYRVVSLHWEDNVDVRVEGELDPLFEATARSAGVRHRAGQTFGGRLLTAAMALPHRRHRRTKPVLFDEIVKPELRTGTGERLQKRRYRVPTSVS
jgi:SAM-dependent methyltransferase